MTLMRSVRRSGLAVVAALATTVFCLSGPAGAHNDKGILSVTDSVVVGMDITVTVTLIYSEDKEPVDGAKVTMAFADDPAGAVQMTAADAAGTYTGKITAKKAGMVKLKLASADPVAELDMDENIDAVTTTTAPSTTTTEKPLPDEEALSPSTVAPTTTPSDSKETDSESGSSWLLPAGIGAAIVVLLAAFVAVSRKNRNP